MEIRVYAISFNDTDIEDINNLSDSKFMNTAEEQGYVWGSLQSFQDAFNNDSYISGDSFFIRFITIKN